MSDAPQLAFSNAPQYYPNQTQQSYAKQETYAHTADAHHTPLKEPTILGLRRRNFWILVVIAIVVIAAAVGGGVGGAFAVKNSGSKSEPTAASQNTSMAVTPSSGGTPLSSSSASASFYAPLPAASVSEIDVSCPPNLRALNDNNNNYQYDCSTDTNILGGDITGMYAYSLQQCIDACSTMNLVRGALICKAVALDRDALAAYRKNHGAICWLENATTPRYAVLRTTIAISKAQ